MHKTKKGSMAIEATIAFTVFICFMFILMAIVKLSLVYITINDVTSETVKKVAGMSYPLSYVNDLIDEQMDNVTKKTNFTSENIGTKLSGKIDKFSKSGDTSIIKIALGSALSAQSAEDLISSVNSIKDNLVEKLLKNLIEFKIEKQTDLAASIYLDLLDKTMVPIDESKITVKLFTFPMSKTEFDAYKENICEITGLTEGDLNCDDVILAVEYDYRIAVPFFPAYDVKLKSMAIERAWLHGGNHVTPSKREGIKIKTEKAVCYTTTGNGHKYHRVKDGSPDCMTLVVSQRNGTVTKTTISAARSMKLKPCGVCRPDEDEER